MEDSKFNLWRATFSFCFVDGFLSSQESDYVQEKLEALPFTAEQKKTLMTDLKSPPDIDKLFPLITKPADRGFLVNNIRLLSRIDNLSPSEKEKISSIEKKVMSKIDMEAVEMKVALDELASYDEEEVYKVHNKNLYSEKLIKSLMKKLNPTDFKFPK